MNTAKYTQLAPAHLVRVRGWTAKVLLGKVYLALHRKAEVMDLLQEVKSNCGCDLRRPK